MLLAVCSCAGQFFKGPADVLGIGMGLRSQFWSFVEESGDTQGDRVLADWQRDRILAVVSFLSIRLRSGCRFRTVRA